MLNTLNAIFTKHRHQPGSLLPILHDIQHALGYVPDDAVPLIAKELNANIKLRTNIKSLNISKTCCIVIPEAILLS